MQDPKKLRVWHLAHGLAVAVIAALPDRRMRIVPGLRAQAIRAATSVAANIAEGCSRASRLEFLHFIEIAIGSLNELESHLDLANDTGVLVEGEHPGLMAKLVMTRRMLLSLRNTLQRRIAEEQREDQRRN